MGQPLVLVVEDDPPVQAVIKRVLATGGYATVTAGNGLEALQAIEKQAPDLILSDINMPRMDGYQLYQALRARAEWVGIPFIFLTARGEREQILKGKALGAEDYLVKPFQFDELLLIVRSRLGRAQAIRQGAAAEFEQLKQGIANVLSHELRTPLFHISGYTELALDTHPSPEALHEFLVGIKQGAERLGRLVNDCLLLVHLESGQAAEEFKMRDKLVRSCNTLVQMTVRRYEPDAAAKKLKLELCLGEELPPVALCEAYFVDALGRLLDNAIRFSRGEGRRVIVTGRAAGDWVEIAVRDEGIGIPPEQLPRLFQRFHQVDRERMEQQGAGIGLAIAQGLIRLHGGEIRAESTLNQGSTFIIRLPVAKEE